MKFLTTACAMLGACTLCASPLQIATDSQSDYVIVIPDNPHQVLKNAASELQQHLNWVVNARFDYIFGTQFKIYNESQRPQGAPAIFIGIPYSPEETYTNAPIDTVAIHFHDGDIYLDGWMPRGPLYAVYTFLEDYVGCRWWTPTENTFPNLPNLTVEANDMVYSPQFISRDTAYVGMNERRFAAALKNNGHFSRVPWDWGGSMPLLGWCHTLHNYIPPEKYFDAHPEWFGMRDGQRVRDRKQQLCLTNAEMRKEFIRNVLNTLRANPDTRLISISQNDGDDHCQCDACKAIEEEEGSPSGLILRFVNEVAGEIHKEFPNVMVETLAYAYTRHPPKITRPADNVIIRLCAFVLDYSQTMEFGDGKNADFRKDLEDWCKIADKLFIWNYTANFAICMIPHPNWRALGSDIRFYANHNAIGIFENGDYFVAAGDFTFARAWILAHLVWNPQLDQRKLMEEFFNGYYGAAGPYLLDYIDFLCDKVEESKFYLMCYISAVRMWLSVEDLEKAVDLYRLAEEAVADDPVFSMRVRRERITLDVACLMAFADINRWERFGGRKYLENIGKTPEELLDEAYRLSMTWKAKTFMEDGTRVENIFHMLRSDIENMAPLPSYQPDICKDLPDSKWDCFLVDELRLHRLDYWVFKEDDPKAVNGRAARLPCTHDAWCVQKPLAGYYGWGGSWKINFHLRLDGDLPDDAVVAFYGVYNTNRKYDVMKGTITAGQLKNGEYTVVSSKPLVIASGTTSDQYLWLSPARIGGDQAPTLYLDYIALTKED